jgi:hypothetical protein
MRRYNIIPRILLILTVSTFALAAPVLVQERRQSGVDEVHVPRAVLGKRALSDYVRFMVDGFENMEGPAEDEPLPNLAEEHVPEAYAPQPNLPEEPVPEVHVPPPNLAEEPVQEVHAPPHDPVDSDQESMVFDDDAPPASPEYGHSRSPSPPTSPKYGYSHSPSPPTSSEWSIDPEFEYWFGGA